MNAGLAFQGSCVAVMGVIDAEDVAFVTYPSRNSKSEAGPQEHTKPRVAYAT